MSNTNNKSDDMSKEKTWIIQRCINAFKDEYENWPEYSTPMSREQMIEALDECNEKWPEYEFRGHNVIRDENTKENDGHG